LKAVLKAPGCTQRLTLKYYKLLLIFAFKFKLRHYTEGNELNVEEFNMTGNMTGDQDMSISDMLAAYAANGTTVMMNASNVTEFLTVEATDCDGTRTDDTDGEMMHAEEFEEGRERYEQWYLDDVLVKRGSEKCMTVGPGGLCPPRHTSHCKPSCLDQPVTCRA
jgi:hypothetical protein